MTTEDPTMFAGSRSITRSGRGNQGAASIQVGLLGVPGVRTGGTWIEFPPDKRSRLLAYLAYSGTWQSRAWLSFLFWPDVPTRQARQNLRQLLKRVQALPWLRGLETDACRLRWVVSTDAGAFLRAVDAGRVQDALRWYRGPLMDGLHHGASTEFDDWLACERERFEARWRALVFRHARDLERAGRHAHAAAWFRSLLAQDDLDEEVLQAYMRSAIRAGQSVAAFRAYQSFARRLRDELGLEPATATFELAEAVRRGHKAPPSRPAVLLPHALRPTLGRSG